VSCCLHTLSSTAVSTMTAVLLRLV
jgi:hypothetical protein